MTIAYVAAAAQDRLAKVREFLEVDGARVVVASHRGAIDDLAAALTDARGATFGVYRKTLHGLATEAAAIALAEVGLTPATRFSLEVVARSVVTQADGARSVLSSPGFAPALARTIEDLALAGVRPEQLVDTGSIDLRQLWQRFDQACQELKIATREKVLRAAREHWKRSELAGLPIAFLDVPLSTRLEADLVEVAICSAKRAVLVVPSDDHRSIDALKRMGVAIEWLPVAGRPVASIEARVAGEATLHNAPTEALECMEAARTVLEECRRGVALDEMVIVVRSREVYAAALTTAFDRAGIPLRFETGSRRPHAGGRALLALLRCRAENGSGRRLFEYLSTAQAPAPSPMEEGEEDEELGRFGAKEEADSVQEGAELRAPLPRPPLRSWLRILGEVGVTRAGAEQSVAEYVDARVAIAAKELEAQRFASIWEEGDSDTQRRYRRAIDEMVALRGGLAPILRALDRVPLRGTWMQFLGALRGLARASLTRPGIVVATIAALEPLARASADETTLDDVIAAVRARFTWLERPASKRGGPLAAVLVTTPHRMRGRSRRVVLVPGLAEGIFPARTHEDPLLSDERREAIDAGLGRWAQRSLEERLLFALCIGAATERVHCSYPRTDSEAGRPRVPSAYALEIGRALSGTLPAMDELERSAAPASRVLGTWPAPYAPELALDDIEYTLAVIRQLKADRNGSVNLTGRARFLLSQHPLLWRALRARWRRHDSERFSRDDGLLATSQSTLVRLADYRLTARAYSPSTLEGYAACPYRFYLRAIVRLSPRLEPDAGEAIDPRVAGELYHRCQALLATRLQGLDLHPQNPAAREAIVSEIHGVTQEVLQEVLRARDPLSPRPFEREMARIVSDLVGWLDKELDRNDGFRTFRAELSFGLPPHSHLAPQSVVDEARIPGGYRIKGAIDAIEIDEQQRIRVTDFKTGKVPDEMQQGFPIVRGGEMLQPLLYALAVESLRGRAVPEAAVVTSARLYYATRRGGFDSTDVAVAPDNVARAVEVLEAVDRAVGSGSLMAAPRKDACTHCVYRVICGKNEEARTSTKRAVDAPTRRALEALRLMRKLP